MAKSKSKSAELPRIAFRPSLGRRSPERGESRTLYKHFTSVSPGQSGHCPWTLRAPMLGGQPLTDTVSSKQTRTARLWIR
jgi:hypothetical protein